MAYLQEIEQQLQVMVNQQTQQARQLGLPPGAAFASYFPQWEISSPQYNMPSSYSLANLGFRTNEFVYSLINKRGRAEGKGLIKVMDTTKDTPEEVKNHKLTKFMRAPNQGVTEKYFWQMKRISQDIAGFAAFEIEKDKLGNPLRLWFMRPDWCAFLRGPQQALRAIRYQPYGLPYQDLPLLDDDGKANILFFSNGEDFDPLYPQIRFMSPTAHALEVIQIDSAMTFFLNDFVKRGAKFSGLLSIADTIDDNISQDYKRRWRQQHGGAENWSDPIILGLGTTYTSMQMNFNDMAFPELDARSESRICNAFDISPIVAEARAGLNVSTYNNKKEAYRDWYQDWVADTWEEDAQTLTNQLLPLFGQDPDNPTQKVDFDTSTVYALKEDRDAAVKRASMMFKDRWVKMNEARKEAGMDPIAETDPETGKVIGDSFYEAVSLKPAQNVNAEGEVVAGSAPQPGQPGGKIPVKLPGNIPPKQPATNAAPKKDTFDFKGDEVRLFRKHAQKYADNPVELASFKFYHLDPDEQDELLSAYGAPTKDIQLLALSMNKLAEALCQPEAK